MTSIQRFIVGLVLLLLSACTAGSGAVGGTETGNTQVSLRVVGYSGTQTAALTVGDLRIDEARVLVERIRLRPLRICLLNAEDEGAEDQVFEGPFEVDLLNPETFGGLEGVSVAEGLYCRLEIVLAKTETSPSIFVSGARADDTAFEMTTDENVEFEIENETTGFAITAQNGLAVFFVAFDLDQWFSGVDVSSPGVDIGTDGNGDPLIRINEDENSDLQDAIEENIKNSADLFRDANQNEEFDGEDRDDALASGRP